MTEQHTETKDEQIANSRAVFRTAVEVLHNSGIPWSVIYVAMVDTTASLLIAGVRDIKKRAVFVNMFTDLTLSDQWHEGNGEKH